MKGKICGINDDHDGKKKHVRVEVEHGKRKRSKGTEGGKGSLESYNMKRSTVTVPRKEASKFTHGQNVKVNLEADDTPPPMPPISPKTEKARGRIRGIMNR